MPKGGIRDSGSLNYLLKMHSISDLYENPRVGASLIVLIALENQEKKSLYIQYLE